MKTVQNSMYKYNLNSYEAGSNYWRKDHPWVKPLWL